MTTNQLTKYIKVSNKLIRVAALGPEEIVRERMAYKFAVTEENAFLNGNGSSKPLGLFVASANGINTDRDVDIDFVSSAVFGKNAYDQLIAAKYTLTAGERNTPKTAWIFHRSVIPALLGIRDGIGRPILVPSSISGSLPTLLDIPVLESEYAPSTWSDNAYIGILGNLERYWILESLSFTIQQVSELFALTNETGFIGRMEIDGAPVLPSAFVRLQLNASNE